MSTPTSLILLLLFTGCSGEAADAAPKWSTQPSKIPSCSKGVCGKGTWAVYHTEKTEGECKAICEGSRTLVPEPDGVIEDVYKFGQNGHFHDVSGKPKAFSRGVKQIRYPGTGGYWDSKFKSKGIRDHFYVTWTGYIEIKTAGKYKFWTLSDDGSRLKFGNDVVVNNPWWHGMRWREGSRDLKAGKIAFTAEMFEGGGGAGMELHYSGPDTNNKRIVVPESVLSSSLSPSTKLMLPDGGLDTLCSAYSFQGSECIIYTACSAISTTADICEDGNFDWTGPKETFDTCLYPDHPVGS